MKAIQLAASVFLAASALATPLNLVKRQSFPLTYEYDDADQFITYSKGWTHLSNQGDIDRKGTESYTNDPNAYLSFPAQAGVEQYYNVTIWAGKKADRGDFKFYVDDQYVGTGHEYDAAAHDATKSGIVFKKDGIKAEADSKFVLKNGGSHYISFDYVVIEYYGP
ncbi:hypothetical protein BT69DRAFT_1336236 [Atractiella rhizophila]|nr:hypothetical protein BT69DRAFT_1336236 [Atractiella rhizophila]